MISGVESRRPHCLAITFDDAYLNNAAYAWPILRRYKAPATFFVPTGYVDNGKFFWADRLDYAIRHLPPREQFVDIGDRWIRLTGGDRRQLVELFWRIKEACATLGWRKAEHVVDSIEALAGARLAASQDGQRWAGIITWEHVRSMQQEGAAFGSHTIGHYPLTELSENEVMRELAESKRQLEQRTSSDCLSVAYPRGACTQTLARMAQEAGYRCAVTTVEKVAYLGNSVMMLPRIGVPVVPISSDDLLVRVMGLSGHISRFRRAVAPTRARAVSRHG
jgi:peptidoglycan/xylan/chitin deacetylase (PgdA/CDA1 family)